MRRGKLEDAAACVQQALQIAHAMRNLPCAAYALVALGNLRIAQARTRVDTRYLKRAEGTLRHALALPALDIETHARGKLALAEVEQLSLMNLVERMQDDVK